MCFVLQHQRQLPGQVMHILHTGGGAFSAVGRHLVRGVAGNENAAVLHVGHYIYGGLPGQHADDAHRYLRQTDHLPDDRLQARSGIIFRLLLLGVVVQVKHPFVAVVDSGEHAGNTGPFNDGDAEFAALHQFTQRGFEVDIEQGA